jgi:FkbM family methyltransferase
VAALAPTDPPGVAREQWSGIAGTTGFDVGAHYGENIPALRGAGCSRVVAFEPEAQLFMALVKYWPGVTCLQRAVSSRDGTMVLLENDGMLGSLAGTVTREVPCVTLDTAAAEYGDPDVVAVDVEGGEAGVLAGASRLLALVKPSWLVEFHTAGLYGTVRRVLEGHGYDVVTIRHPDYPEGSGLWHGHGWVKALRPG